MKLWNRIVGFLLVPCLLAEPAIATASALARPFPAAPLSVIHPDVFTCQAVVQALGSAEHDLALTDPKATVNFRRITGRVAERSVASNDIQFWELRLSAKKLDAMYREQRAVDLYKGEYQTMLFEIAEYVGSIIRQRAYAIQKALITELVQNSLDAIVEKSYEAQHQKRPYNGFIRIVVEVANEHLFIRVIDNGIGIPTHELPSLLAGQVLPTHKRKLKAQGFPLGHNNGAGINNISPEIHSLGGDLSFNQRPGGGTIVTIKYPLPAAAPKSDSPPHASMWGPENAATAPLFEWTNAIPLIGQWMHNSEIEKRGGLDVPEHTIKTFIAGAMFIWGWADTSPWWLHLVVALMWAYISGAYFGANHQKVTAAREQAWLWGVGSVLTFVTYVPFLWPSFFPFGQATGIVPFVTGILLNITLHYIHYFLKNFGLLPAWVPHASMLDDDRKQPAAAPLKIKELWQMTREEFLALAQEGKMGPFRNEEENILAVASGVRRVAIVDRDHLSSAQQMNLLTQRLPPELNESFYHEFYAYGWYPWRHDEKGDQYVVFKSGNELFAQKVIAAWAGQKGVLEFSPPNAPVGKKAMFFDIQLGRALGYQEADIVCFLNHFWGYDAVIERAILEGKDVSPAVLEEYAQFHARYAEAFRLAADPVEYLNRMLRKYPEGRIVDAQDKALDEQVIDVSAEVWFLWFLVHLSSYEKPGYAHQGWLHQDSFLARYQNLAYQAMQQRLTGYLKNLKVEQNMSLVPRFFISELLGVRLPAASQNTLPQFERLPPRPRADTARVVSNGDANVERSAAPDPAEDSRVIELNRMLGVATHFIQKMTNELPAMFGALDQVELKVRQQSPFMAAADIQEHATELAGRIRSHIETIRPDIHERDRFYGTPAAEDPDINRLHTKVIWHGMGSALEHMGGLLFRFSNAGTPQLIYQAIDAVRERLRQYPLLFEVRLSEGADEIRHRLSAAADASAPAAAVPPPLETGSGAAPGKKGSRTFLGAA